MICEECRDFLYEHGYLSSEDLHDLDAEEEIWWSQQSCSEEEEEQPIQEEEEKEPSGQSQE